MSEPLLEIEDLTVQYTTDRGNVTAVSDASFTIEEGDYFGLVGESGCGKSTVAKSIIGGLDSNGKVTSGAIRYRGTEIQDLTEEELNEEIRWKEISLIPQGAMSNLDPLQTVGDQATEIAQRHTDMTEKEALERFGEMFDVVGLPQERIDEYPHQFSGGMAQRTIIAMALFLEPAMIIADEPTTALDVIMQDQVFKYMDQIRDELETSMMLITHDISVVFESCNSIAVMHGGQVAETGSITDVYDSPRHPYSVLLQQAFPDVRYPNRDLEVIEGSPPQEMGEVSHCTFVDRCPLATEDCRQAEPPLEQVTTDDDRSHQVACYHHDRAAELRDDGRDTDQERARLDGNRIGETSSTGGGE